MKSEFIYIVGQPDPQSNTVDSIHTLGYKVGLLSDSRLEIKHPERYDRIEKVDFQKLDEEMSRLSKRDPLIAGVVCTYENYIVSKAKLGAFFHVPTLSVESARLSTDKSLMRQAFITADPSISPEFAAVDTLEQALRFAREHGYPLIIKPTNLVKSLLVLKCDNEEQLKERFLYASETIGRLYKKYKIFDREPQLIIEEFITGDQYSIAAFVDEQGTPHFCEGIVHLKNAQDIGVDDNFLYSRTLPANLPDNITARMFEVAEKGVRALKMSSVPAHIELMVGAQGVKIIEIGARIGGYRPRMYKYSYGIDLTTQEVNLALGRLPQLSGDFTTYCAVYELFSQTEGPFMAVSGHIDSDQLAYYRVTVAEGDLTGPAKNGYKAAAIIIVTADDHKHFQSLCKQVEMLSIEVKS